jgi:nucleoside-diphosphate-sugar epimerase
VAVLITGLGYIGSALAARLLADGERVIAVENFFSTPSDALLPLVQQSGLTLIEGSITDPAVLARAFATTDIETVFHLAAQASTHPDAAPIAYTVDVNYAGTRLLLDACAAHGVAQVVLASSTRLYRTPLPRRVHEGSPIHAADLVHLSQLYGEVLLATYLHTAAGRMRGVAVRLGIVTGVGPVVKTDPRFLAAPQRFCLAAAAGAPLQVATGSATVLPFVHIDDAVEGLRRSRQYQGPATVVNVASEVRSVASVAESVRVAAEARGLATTLAYQGRPRPYRARHVESALATVGFHPSRSIDAAIGPLLDHYLSIVSAPGTG